MFYSECRGLKAFGVYQYGKQIMQIISTAIDNDQNEYKYKYLYDVLNYNSNKQTQKLQGIICLYFSVELLVLLGHHIA